jgi:hypothetical protein
VSSILTSGFPSRLPSRCLAKGQPKYGGSARSGPASRFERAQPFRVSSILTSGSSGVYAAGGGVAEKSTVMSTAGFAYG